MSNYKKREFNYKEIVEQIGEQKFEERLEELLNAADEYIRQSGYEGHVECNARIMLNVLFDYFVDIFRLKAFHDIEKIRTEKIFAYTVAWIVRRKPLQFIQDTDEEKDMFINERFGVYLLLNECLLGGRKEVCLQREQREVR